MSEFGNAPEVRKFDNHLTGTEKAFGGVAALASAGLLIAAGRNFAEATNLVQAINSDAFKAGLAGLAGVALAGEALNEKFTAKDDKGKYRAISLVAAAGLVTGALFVHGGGSSEASADSNVSTTVITSPARTPANGTIMSTNSTTTTIGTASTEGLGAGIGGFPCEIVIPFQKHDGLGMAKIQGALDELNDPRYNAGPTDGIQGPKTKAALFNYKSDHGYDPNQPISLKMCNEFESLTDNNPDTPLIPDYHPGS